MTSSPAMKLAPAVIALVALVLATTAPALAAPTQAQLQKERSETAEKVYQASILALKTGKATTEVVYQWSVRWAESEFDRATMARLKKQALVEHAARMLALETEAAKQQAAGLSRVMDTDAATYYRIEADLWVLRGKLH